MPSVTWFEIPARDPERARRFYAEIFGWQIRPFPAPNRRWLIRTAGPGASAGALTRREAADQPITLFINVPFLDEYMRKVKECGGEILSDVEEVPDWGCFVTCRDPEGNRFGLWESVQGRMPQAGLPATPPVETEFLSPEPELEPRPRE